MSSGILELLGSFTTLVFAMLPAFAGVQLLVRGDLFFGVGLIGAAIAMVVADHYILTPSDLPKLVASKLVGAVVRTPDEE